MTDRYYGFWGRTADAVESRLDEVQRERDELRARLERVRTIVDPHVCRYGRCLDREGPQCLACQVMAATKALQSVPLK